MKRCISIIVMLMISLLSSISLLADNTTSPLIDGDNRKIIWINGFDFDTLNTPIEMIDIDLESGTTSGANVFIGYSMGGLRAMASTADMSTAELEDLKAIITINSPLKGFRGLFLGWPLLHNYVSDAVDILSDGIAMSIFADPTLALILDIATDSTVLHEIINLFDFELNEPSIIGQIYADPLGIAHRTIADMTPNSVFLRSHVWDETTNKLSPVLRSSAGEHIKFGFIVGNEHDPANLVIYDGPVDITLGGIIENCKDVYIAGQIQNNILAAAHAMNPPLHIYYITAAIKCLEAYNWCDDFDENYAQIIGSSQHDMLIAKTSQYLAIPDNRRIKQNLPYHYSATVDHSEALSHDHIWGDDGKWKDRLSSTFDGQLDFNDPDGFVVDFLDELTFD